MSAVMQRMMINCVLEISGRHKAVEVKRFADRNTNLELCRNLT